MADLGDDLLEGDLDVTAFGDLDAEEEDALLADEDYDSYKKAVFDSSQQADRHSELFHVINHVQDVSEGDEIIEDGDVLELAVVDELDESEVESNSLNNTQTWTQIPSREIKAESHEEEVGAGVTSSTSAEVIGGESDEEENEDRGSRFKTERTNVISLKNVSTGKSLKDIPDSLDKVQTAPQGATFRPRGGMLRGGRGNIRGRLGPMPRGGMGMRGGFGPMGPMRPRPPPMMPPHMQHQMSGPKIHVNPHFRGGMHETTAVWDNERLPPPPGCDGYAPQPPPPVYQNDGTWGPCYPGPSPAFPPRHPGPPSGQFENSQTYLPQQQQGYAEPQLPINPPQENQPTRRVQFSENSQLVTVENQHFQRSPQDQNFSQGQNQFQQPPNALPHFNNFHSPTPDFHQQPFPSPNPHPNNMGYNQPGYHPSPNPSPYQHFDSTPNNWNHPTPGPVPIENHQNNYYPPNQPCQPAVPPAFGPPPPQPQPQFRLPFPNQDPNFRPPPQQQFSPNPRVSVMKRLAPRQPPISAATPVKQMRFEHKPKISTTVTRSNLQEIKTVDNLPDTTYKDPEPEIEEDEETKQYRLKIAEQKALREKILKEKEARRLASIIEKQRQQETSASTVANQVNTSQLQPPQIQQQSQPRPQQVQMQQHRPQVQQHQLQIQQPHPRMQMQQARMRIQQPGMRMQQTRMRMQQPGMRMQPPGMRMQQPRIRPQQPGLRMQQPGMHTQQPGMHTQQPGMRMQHPRARMQQLRMPMQPPQMPKQQPQIQIRMQTQQPQMQFTGRGRGRAERISVNKVLQSQKPHSSKNTPAQQSNTAKEELQDMLGTVYKIVKVRTKEGAIVTRKTPLVKNEANNTLAPMKIVNTSGPVQRRIVVNSLEEASNRMVNTGQKGGAQNNVRVVSSKVGVQTNASNNVPGAKPTSQRLVIDNRVTNALTATPEIPNSTLVTIENLSLSTSKVHLQKLAKEVGNLSSFKHEPELKRATLKFKQPKEAAQFYTKFHRKMIDLSRITVTVIPE